MDIYDYVKVSLPDTNRACLENRPEAKPNRCGAERDVLLGEQVGSCGYNTHTLEKVIIYCKMYLSSALIFKSLELIFLHQLTARFLFLQLLHPFFH